LDKAFLDNMEQLLLSQKRAIVSSLISDRDEFSEITKTTEMPKDSVDDASNDIGRSLLEALGTADMKRLKAIDAAISRIKQGKYGVCIKCGQPIPQTRLEALPYALLCINCKSAEEKRAFAGSK
jgi:RNA polymerase-binding protein DksA